MSDFFFFFGVFLGVREQFPSVFQRNLHINYQHNCTALCFDLGSLNVGITVLGWLESPKFLQRW